MFPNLKEWVPNTRFRVCSSVVDRGKTFNQNTFQILKLTSMLSVMCSISSVGLEFYHSKIQTFICTVVANDI